MSIPMMDLECRGLQYYIVLGFYRYLGLGKVVAPAGELSLVLAMALFVGLQSTHCVSVPSGLRRDAVRACSWASMVEAFALHGYAVCSERSEAGGALALPRAAMDGCLPKCILCAIRARAHLHGLLVTGGVVPPSSGLPALPPRGESWLVVRHEAFIPGSLLMRDGLSVVRRATHFFTSVPACAASV